MQKQIGSIVNGFLILGLDHVDKKNNQYYYKMECSECSLNKVSTISNLKKSKGCINHKVRSTSFKRIANFITTNNYKMIKSHEYVEAVCNCGEHFWIAISNLSRQKSCGCFKSKVREIQFDEILIG